MVAAAVIVEIIVLSSSSSAPAAAVPPVDVPGRRQAGVHVDRGRHQHARPAEATRRRLDPRDDAVEGARAAADIDHGARRASTRATRPPIRRSTGRRTTASSRWRARAGSRSAFNVTAPGPLWAMARGAPSPRYARPLDAVRGRVRPVRRGRRTPLQRQLHATRRRRGRCRRCRYWSIWNEPNQPGWLAPQWQTAGRPARRCSRRRCTAPTWTPRTRRWRGPGTSRPRDTLLIGELAPEGCEPGGPCVYSRENRSIPPIPFVRALYCLDSSYQPLSGRGGARSGAPQSGDRERVRGGQPGPVQGDGVRPPPVLVLPVAGGFDVRTRTSSPLSDLGRLERALDCSVRRVRGRAPAGPVPDRVWIRDEPAEPVPRRAPGRPGAVPDEAAYIAWRDPRVRALSQFLLYDSPPDAAFRPGTQGYWSTFQTGLLYQNGAAKPSYGAYRLPVFVPDPRVARGRRC